ncbi:MAG: RNA 3'-terminal phosphate cyclase [Candidatus Nitrosotenuis sp.]
MTLIEIDGSYGEGGGQILRSALTLSAITQKPIQIQNIRHNRKVPGLRPSHLSTIKILGKICNAKIDGLAVGSTSITFTPGQIQDTKIYENVGTAGSISLILQAIIPIALAGKKLELSITGGTDVPWSPTSNYTKFVLSEAYSRLGIKFEMNIKKRGYYPKGGGQVDITIHPCHVITPINLTKRNSKDAKILCSYSGMDKNQISNSVNSAKEILCKRGFSTQSEIIQENALNPGASFTVYSYDENSINGADELYDAKTDFTKSATTLFTNNDLGADTNLSDMLVTPLSLCKEISIFTVKEITPHLETNLHITSEITGCKSGVSKINGGYEVRIIGSETGI